MNIPAGVDNGMSVVLQAEVSANGGPRGDLLVEKLLILYLSYVRILYIPQCR